MLGRCEGSLDVTSVGVTLGIPEGECEGTACDGSTYEMVELGELLGASLTLKSLSGTTFASPTEPLGESLGAELKLKPSSSWSSTSNIVALGGSLGSDG